MDIINNKKRKLAVLWSKAYYANRALGLIVYRTPVRKIVTFAFWSRSIMFVYLHTRKN